MPLPSLPFPPLKSNTCVTEIYNIVTSFSYVYGAHVCGLNIHVRGVLYKIVFIVLLKQKKVCIINLCKIISILTFNMVFYFLFYFILFYFYNFLKKIFYLYRLFKVCWLSCLCGISSSSFYLFFIFLIQRVN